MEMTDTILSIPSGAEFFRVRLIALMEAHEMEPWKLANEAGIKQSSLDRWASGRSMPTLCDDLENIANVLSVSVAWLCWGGTPTGDLFKYEPELAGAPA